MAIAILVALTIGANLTGCGPPDVATQNASAPNSATLATVATRSDSKTIQPATYSEIKASAVQQAKGRYVVADLWATWCTYCLKELPHLSELQERYPKRLQCVAINLDLDTEEGQLTPDQLSKIEKTLAQLQVDCARAICSEPMVQVVESLGVFALPAVLVMDDQGNVIKKFDGEFNYRDDVQPFLDELLQDAPSH